MRHDSRPGLSLEQIQMVAGLSSPKKGSQWLDPAVLKIAMCMLMFPEATLRELNHVMPRARRELMARGVFQRMPTADAVRLGVREELISADEVRSTRSPFTTTAG